MNLQQLLLDCQHIGQSTIKWMHDQMEDQSPDDHVVQLTVEWGFTNCHRILEQYNRLLAPETHHGKKALYSSLRQQLDDMEDGIAGEHTLDGLETLVSFL